MPPIANASSCSIVDLKDNETDYNDFSNFPLLVSSDETLHVEHSKEQNVELIPTCIKLPMNRDLRFHPDDEHAALADYSAQINFLHLPLHYENSNCSSMAIDEYLNSIPSLRNSADCLLSQNVFIEGTGDILKYSDIDNTVLNIFQGEIASATSSQVDILMSAKATTCHIVAIRSNSGEVEALSTLTHIDKAGYENSLREMILEHKLHHNRGKKSSGRISKIEMDLHIVGGFVDVDNSSRQITHFLINFFARIAEEEFESITITLKTCAVSCMNDDGMHCPLCRGMGILCDNGKIFPVMASTGHYLPMGPEFALRSSRLWAGSRENLSHIHSSSSPGILSIEPFKFSPFEQLDLVLQLSDCVLLECISTSPDVEEDDFCENIRKVLCFIKKNSWGELFGPQCDQPILYESFTTKSGKIWQEIK